MPPTNTSCVHSGKQKTVLIGIYPADVLKLLVWESSEREKKITGKKTIFENIYGKLYALRSLTVEILKYFGLFFLFYWLFFLLLLLFGGG